MHSDYKLDYLGRPLAAMTYGLLNSCAPADKYHIGVSDAMRDMLIERGFRHNDTFAIYNGVDFEREIPAADREAFYARTGAKIAPGDVVVGAAARLDPVKDLATLLRAVAEARKTAPNVKLIIAGEGAERAHLEQLASELGIEGAFTLCGWIDDMDEFYGSIDINTLTSNLGGLPIRHNRGRGPSPAHGRRRAWAAYPSSLRTAKTDTSWTSGTTRPWRAHSRAGYGRLPPSETGRGPL